MLLDSMHCSCCSMRACTEGAVLTTLVGSLLCARLESPTQWSPCLPLPRMCVNPCAGWDGAPPGVQCGQRAHAAAAGRGHVPRKVPDHVPGGGHGRKCSAAGERPAPHARLSVCLSAFPVCHLTFACYPSSTHPGGWGWNHTAPALRTYPRPPTGLFPLPTPPFPLPYAPLPPSPGRHGHPQALASALRANQAHGHAAVPNPTGEHLLFSAQVAVLGTRPVLLATPSAVVSPSDVALFTKRVVGLTVGDSELALVGRAAHGSLPQLGDPLGGAVFDGSTLTAVHCT